MGEGKDAGSPLNPEAQELLGQAAAIQHGGNGGDGGGRSGGSREGVLSAAEAPPGTGACARATPKVLQGPRLDMSGHR
jgi:hypothetical protein